MCWMERGSCMIDGWDSADVSRIGGEAGCFGAGLVRLFYEGKIVKVGGGSLSGPWDAR